MHGGEGGSDEGNRPRPGSQQLAAGQVKALSQRAAGVIVIAAFGRSLYGLDRLPTICHSRADGRLRVRFLQQVDERAQCRRHMATPGIVEH